MTFSRLETRVSELMWQVSDLKGRMQAAEMESAQLRKRVEELDSEEEHTFYCLRVSEDEWRVVWETPHVMVYKTDAFAWWDVDSALSDIRHVLGQPDSVDAVNGVYTWRLVGAGRQTYLKLDQLCRDAFGAARDSWAKRNPGGWRVG